ncbi:MAG: Coenzyme F420 hydrogenase/dehydrogenase, beta subunit C-terminal domain [Methanophagales archaeon]|nr:Coenzyme F420 hydrogenase/dehydrogenase, beta subunit C-terminal domain [Methanophagales archaeon]
MIDKTISKVVKSNLCTGCGTCIALCPEKAIRLTINEKKGIYIPELNEEKCNNCGICYKVCPGHEVDFKILNLEIFGKEPKDDLIGNYLNCYIGHSTDYDIRYNSSSGGLVTALLIFALEQGIIDGAIVTRMRRDKPLEPEPFIARTKEEIIEASKSKYCPVPANVALKEILNSKEGERFAVVGLPCHIHGIRKAEQINKKLKQKIVLHIGIFCGLIPNFMGTEFLLRKLKLQSKDIVILNYRGEGWPGKMSLKLRNNETKIIPYPAYWDGFGSSFYPFRCTLCSDWTSELADISFGDAWLPEIVERDKIGTSLIITRNEKSNGILQQMISQSKIELNEITRNEVVISQRVILFKKRDVKARLILSKLLGKNVPIYNQKLSKPKFNACFGAILRYSQMFLANRRLWKLLVLYLSLLRCVGYVKSKLKL